MKLFVICGGRLAVADIERDAVSTIWTFLEVLSLPTPRPFLLTYGECSAVS